MQTLKNQYNIQNQPMTSETFIGETVYKTTLKNGLEVHLMPKKHFAKKYAFFATRYGGLYNDYALDGKTYQMPQGIAHFLEHQIFEDQEKSSFERFEELGANLNAYTSYNSTVYHFDTIDHFETGIKLLIEMVQNTDISDASVAKEIEVIDQEIRMYMDEPVWDLSTNLYRGLFHHHPIRSEIAGSVESIREIDKEKIIQCFEHFYAPSNMVLFLYGDLDIAETCVFLDALFEEPLSEKPLLEDQGAVAKSKPSLVLPEEPYHVNYHRKEVDKDIGKGMMLVGFKGDPNYFVTDRELKVAALKIATDLMFGRSSGFYMMAYEAGIVTDAFDFDLQLGEGYAFVLVGNETDEIDLLYTKILEEIQKHLTNGFDADDFMRMKRKIMGRTVASFNSLQSIAGNYTQSVMRGNDLFKQMEAYKTLTLVDMQQVVNAFFDLENHTLSAVRSIKMQNKKNAEEGEINE